MPAAAGGPQGEPQDLLPSRGFGGRDRAPGRDFEPEPLVAVLGSAGNTAVDQVVAGQALQRVLLTATDAGLGVSMLSQPIEVPSAREQLRLSLGRFGTPQMVLRIGYGQPGRPTPRAASARCSTCRWCRPDPPRRTVRPASSGGLRGGRVPAAIELAGARSPGRAGRPADRADLAQPAQVSATVSATGRQVSPAACARVTSRSCNPRYACPRGSQIGRSFHGCTPAARIDSGIGPAQLGVRPGDRHARVEQLAHRGVPGRTDQR